MRIVITNGWHDDNKGDCAIVDKAIELLKQHLPVSSVTLISEFADNDRRRQDGYRHLIANHRDMEVAVSIIPIIPIIPIVSPANRKKQINRFPFIYISQAILYTNMAFLTIFSNFILRGKKIWAWRKRDKAVLKAIFNADLVLMKGGGDLSSGPGLRKKVRLFRILLPSYLALIMNKPLYIFPQSIWKLDSRVDKLLAAPVLRRAKAIMVREKQSQEYVWNRFKQKAEMLPDLAFAFSAGNKNAKFIPEILPKDCSNLIGISVRPWFGRTGSNYHSYLEAISNAVTHLLTKDDKAKAILLPQSIGPTDEENDLLAFDDLLATMTDEIRNRVIDYREDLSPQALCNLYEHCSIIISSRCHATILAATVGTPSIAISYVGPKTTGIMSLLGLESYVVDIEKVSSSDIIKLATKAESQRDELREHLIHKTSEFAAELNDRMRKLAAEFGIKSSDNIAKD